MTEHENRLRLETSPYLLQHAKNPVDWYPWGDEALARAKRENKPIFLSVGYAACHWCHVMERESFENARIAEFLNEHFVSVKVDREERPDIDEIYMSATVALSGSGGWPMSVFMTPEQRPFFAGTYFPPTDRWGRPGFITLLTRIAELWKTNGASLAAEAEELTRHVKQHGELSGPGPLGGAAIPRAVADFARSFDAEHGGFGAAPKFPPHQGLRLLLRAHANGDASALAMVRRTLDAMKDGGIYDHVGGGFARYSTDARWLVPHFEKMLYDNAQLTRAYLEAFQVTGDSEYERVARETLDYVAREMQGPEGGYYSATDADSEGEEGKFFVFVPEELDDILGRDQAEAFCLHYDITVGGNWEGKNVLNTPRPLAKTAQDLGRDPTELARELAASRQKVYEARKERVPPLLDDKVLAAWNGLMIDAMAEGYRVLGDARYLASAERAADFALTTLARPDGGLFRTARAGKAHIPAFLEDYAYLTDALISLYEVSGSPRFLAAAERLAARMIDDFASPEGGFFHTANAHEALITRLREGHDGALPNANAVAARALARLSYHLDSANLLARAEATLTAFGAFVERSPRAFASALLALDLLLAGPTELVLVGKPGAPDTKTFERALARHYLPRHVFVRSDPANPNATPLARDKAALNGVATLYVCRNGTCQSPLTDPSAVVGALARDQSERTPRPGLEAKV